VPEIGSYLAYICEMADMAIVNSPQLSDDHRWHFMNKFLPQVVNILIAMR